MKKCVILATSSTPSGPIKGSVALANGLADMDVQVTLIFLRLGKGVNSIIDSKVNVINLGFTSNFFMPLMIFKVGKIIAKIKSADNLKLPIISSCFSADFVNFFSTHSVMKVSSIRGDLEANYSMDNRYLGKLISKFHYFIIRNFDLAFALNKEMKKILIKKNIRNISLVPNFLNERDLIPFKKISEMSSNTNLIFVGTLSKRKKPQLLIKTVAQLNEKGYSFKLKIIGTGPLFNELSSLINSLDDKGIELLGFHSDPMTYLKEADILVLPSVSEGTPRAVMEALFIGVPCIMRNLETNDNLVTDGVNGVLFEKDIDLENAILKAVKLKPGINKNVNLLDASFSQNKCSKNIITEINSFL